MANEEPGRIGAMIASQGWAALSGRQVRALTGIVHGPEWDAFGRSWSALGDDRYMADGGRYRRRRHAVLALTDGEVRTLPPRPHYQSRDYNSLNGGIERWFAQVQPEVVDFR
jgi:hypothetical protein